MAEEGVENDESLIALTTHFAQVQFRLKQIISADADHKEVLLKDLERFAFQGCGRPMSYDTAASGENASTESQRQMRLELMQQLRSQLEDIEQCAREATASGGVAGGVAQDAGTIDTAEGDVFSAMAEKQRIIIEELRKRFDFQFGDLESLSPEEVKKSVGKAVSEVVDPIRSKEEYVSHLQGQIKDLERYITFLQTKQVSSPDSEHRHSLSHDHTSHDPTSHDLTSPHVLTSPVLVSPHLTHRPHGISLDRQHSTSKHVTFAKEKWESPYDNPPVPQYRLSMTQLDEGVACAVDAKRCEWEKMDSLGNSLHPSSQGPDDLRLSLTVMRKTLALMEVLTLCQCGGSLQCLPKYVADGKRKRYHMALQSLEMAVDKISIITTAINEPGLNKENKVSLETDLHETVSMLLADSLRVLLEHGLLSNGRPVSITEGCLPAWRKWGLSGRGLDALGSTECPAWRVLMYYYKMKNGEKFSTRTEELLSSSFALGSNSKSVKKTLLSSISKVCGDYKASYHTSRDTKFRALVCEGFNLRHLAEWFKILSSNPSIGDDLYMTSAFITTTGFRPAIACLERLKDNPSCEPLTLPQSYYQYEDAFLRS